MIEGANPLLQSLYGTLFTWGLTALGSAVVFVVQNEKRSVLDASLGFAAGVMTAASFWSLLAPAIEMAADSKMYGSEGEFAFVPVAFGFIIGAGFVYAADVFISTYGLSSVKDVLGEPMHHKKNDDVRWDNHSNTRGVGDNQTTSNQHVLLDINQIKHRKLENSSFKGNYIESQKTNYSKEQWKRILLMIIAITVHNIPEGLAVGVGFGAVGKSPNASFRKAKNLAIGIGIQNFPEGMAVSLPLRGARFSLFWSFWWGQLSGMVEPIAGLLGAYSVSLCEPLLPYALAFAAGAMIFVVFDDIIPEAQSGNGRLASIWGILGFTVMMILDVGFG